MYNFNINPENKEVFKELITNYINKRFFDIVYKYIVKYINYEETFNNKDSLIWFYFKIEFWEIGLVWFKIIKSEIIINRSH